MPLRCHIKILGHENVLETIFSKTYSEPQTLFDTLTSRELEVLRELAAGKTSKQIGSELFISHHTVDPHRRKLLKKLNCKTVVDLTRLAFKKALL